jgi:flagellum-specific peptidoglycan hydrolase FlgJ
MLAEAKRKFLNELIHQAVALEDSTGIPAEVVVGQGVWESAWGQSALARKANNLFGVKAGKGWKGDTIKLKGYEYENGKNVYSMMLWRKYPTIKDSIADHAEFLSKPRYTKAFLTTTYTEFLTAIHKAGYATDPKYVQGITRLVNSYGIVDSITKERQALLKKEQAEPMKVALPSSTFLQRILSMIK